MSELKGHISNWLIELDEEKAINFFNDCEIDTIYIDTLFSMDDDIETYMHDVTISVPLKIYRKIDEYSQEVSIIESAITECGQSDGIYVRNINWRPYLKDEYKKQSDRKAIEITQILTQEYVDKQVRLMNNSINSNPHLALGISKELIETCCKHILIKYQKEINKEWDITKLVKETNKQINK